LKYKLGIFILIFILLINCSFFKTNQNGTSKTTIILLHGLARTQRSMATLQNRLSKQGYKVHNIGYPSTKLSIEEIVEYIDNRIRKIEFNPESQINFVTHSLGGIVLRLYLRDHKMSKLGRVVMISPPNRGSELADFIKGNFILEEIFGEASKQLTTDKNSLPNKLGPVDFEVGVITGDKNMNPFYSFLFSSPNDGKVSVEKTKVAGMKDFLVVHENHQFIVHSEIVFNQILNFLEFGNFLQTDTKPEI